MPSRRSIDAATAELPELATLIAQLSVLALDLRAQYEAKVRILTEIQREIEALRVPARRGAQARSLDRLERQFEALAAANRDASQALTMVREAFSRVAHARPAAHALDPGHNVTAPARGPSAPRTSSPRR